MLLNNFIYKFIELKLDCGGFDNLDTKNDLERIYTNTR